MIWLSWRQQRLESVLMAGLLVLVAALLVPLGMHMASAYTGSGAAACATRWRRAWWDCRWAARASRSGAAPPSASSPC